MPFRHCPYFIDAAATPLPLSLRCHTASFHYHFDFLSQPLIDIFSLMLTLFASIIILIIDFLIADYFID
jgi:hypothetical protein